MGSNPEATFSPPQPPQDQVSLHLNLRNLQLRSNPTTTGLSISARPVAIPAWAGSLGLPPSPMVPI